MNLGTVSKKLQPSQADSNEYSRATGPVHIPFPNIRRWSAAKLTVAASSRLGDGDSTDFGDVVASVATEYPVMFGEMGTNRPTPWESEGENAIQFNIAWAQQNRLVGYVQWDWSAYTNSNTYGMLHCDALSCLTGNPYEPNDFGTPEFDGGGSTLN